MYIQETIVPTKKYIKRSSMIVVDLLNLYYIKYQLYEIFTNYIMYHKKVIIETY